MAAPNVIGTPWLKDIPLLGWAFKKDSDSNTTARLVIAVQARIERTPEEEIADSIRQRIGFERSNRRVEPLVRDAGTAWALRVATRSDEAEARAVAAKLPARPRPARITRWESSSGPQFDVTLSGFASVSDANAAAFALRDRGYDPELVVVPLEAD
jgi:hypothetical protein